MRVHRKWMLLLALAACGHAQAATWYVDAGGSGIAFVPQVLMIEAGDRVTFINRGGYHNVVADDGAFRCAHGCDGDGMGGDGNASSDFWIATVTFPAPGTYGYFCEPHGAPGSGMFGTIIVAAPLPPPQPAPSAAPRAYALLALALAGIALSALHRRRRPGASRSG